jgi:hypothetical protein
MFSIDPTASTQGTASPVNIAKVGYLRRRSSSVVPTKNRFDGDGTTPAEYPSNNALQEIVTMLKNASVYSRFGMVAVLCRLMSLGALAGCANVEGTDEIYAEENESVGETSQALSAEICNGLDDDGDFMIDEDAADTRAGAACDCAKTVYAGHEYLVCEDQLNQATALAMTRGHGFSLARIEGDLENNFLQPYVVGTQGFWIDLNDRAVEGTYRWENGIQATFTKWSQYEPNNYNNEDCAMMWDTGKWNDINCAWTNKTFGELLNPVQWTSATSVSINGTTLTKEGTNNGWDAGAASIDERDILSGNGYMQFSTNENTTTKAAGLNDVDSGDSLAEIDYAIVLTSNKLVQIYERNGWRGDYGTYVPGDVFRVEILDGQVRYLRNGALMYSHNVTPTYPLFADSSIHTPGGTIADVRIQSCGADITNCIIRGYWKNAQAVLAKDGTVKKVGGAGGLDGFVSSVASYSGNVYAEFKSPDVGKVKLAGLDSDDGTSFNEPVAYAIRFTTDANGNGFASADENRNPAWGCTQAGADPESVTTVSYAAGDKFRIEVRGSKVTYYKNDRAFCGHPTSAPSPLVLDEYLGTINTMFTESKIGAL